MSTKQYIPSSNWRNLDQFGSTSNNANLYNNKIQDGLDDLITGATGIRRNKIKAIKQQADKFRAAGNFENVAKEGQPPAGAQFCTQTPELYNMIQFPERIAEEDGTMSEFPNYIHFRSLKRRAGNNKDFRHDIFLYVPDTLNDNLAVTYTEAELGILDSLIANFVKTEQVQEGWGVDKQEMATIMKSMAPGGKMMMSASGRGVNPLKYQLFEGVAFRTFAYTFTLRPKNEKEAKIIQEILWVFKREALPGVEGTNSRIYTFPTEWSIQFVGPIKEWVDFPLVSVLTGVNVDYAGGQPLALMADGAPSVVTLTVNFTETTQLTRQKFDEWVSSFYNTIGGRDLNSVEEGTKINARTAIVQAQLEKERIKIEEVTVTAKKRLKEITSENISNALTDLQKTPEQLRLSHGVTHGSINSAWDTAQQLEKIKKDAQKTLIDFGNQLPGGGHDHIDDQIQAIKDHLTEHQGGSNTDDSGSVKNVFDALSDPAVLGASQGVVFTPREDGSGSVESTLKLPTPTHTNQGSLPGSYDDGTGSVNSVLKEITVTAKKRPTTPPSTPITPMEAYANMLASQFGVVTQGSNTDNTKAITAVASKNPKDTLLDQTFGNTTWYSGVDTVTTIDPPKTPPGDN